MATKQTIIWTALPNGWAQEAASPTLKLSVFVSVRLETTEGLPKPTLSQFPDLLQWTTKVPEMTFAVRLGSTTVAAQRVGPELEPDLWAALFKPTTYVRPYRDPTQLTQANVLSHPVRNVGTFIKSQYQSIATTSPMALPKRELLVEKLSPVTLFVAPEVKPRAAGVGGTARPMQYRAATPVPQATMPTQLHVQAGELQTFSQKLRPQVRSRVMKDARVLLPTPEVKLRQQALDNFKVIAQELHQFRAVPPGPANPTKDFLQLATFHRPAVVSRVPLQVPEIDFHQFLSSLGNYPELMRRLGLVIDLLVPAPGSMPSSGVVSVIPTWTPELAASENFTPRTSYTANQTTKIFRVTPGPDADIVNGMLKINDDQHPILNYDIDAAALKTLHLTENLQTQVAKAAPAAAATSTPSAPMQVRSANVEKAAAGSAGQPQVMMAALPPSSVERQAVATLMLRSAGAAVKPPAAPRPVLEGLPPLRTAGISVARTGRALMLAKTLDRVAKHNQAVAAKKPDDVTFYAEDVVRGYRVDIWDSQTNSWRSLCRRQGTYKFLEAGISREYEDEGWIQMAGTQSPDKPSPDTVEDVYLHEAMFRWDGWSLSAPRPGKHLDNEGRPQRGDDPAKEADQAQTQFKMVTSFKPVPGSLPKLRFGTKYRVRARAVDLAGNGLLLDQVNPADFSQASPEHTYTRFEPVVSPLTILTRSLIGNNLPGESLDHVAIRSNFDRTAEEYRAVFAELTNNPEYVVVPERLLVPPKTSQLMAERHGMFDLASGAMRPSAETYELIRQRADASFAKDPYSRCPMQEGLEVPYLPDPLARGASVLMLDRKGNAIGDPRLISFFPGGAEWPNASGFRIRVVEGAQNPTSEWNEGERVLTLALPKADFVTLRVSSYFGDGDVGLQNQAKMGIWNWIREASPTEHMKLRDMAVRGRHWMLTPSRDLVFIHPVQQPLIQPEFHKLTATRLLGATYTYVGDDQPMPIDGKSTVKLDVQAAWEDPVDDVKLPEPTKTSTQAHVYEYQVDLEDTEVSQTLAPAFDADINRQIRHVTLTPVAAVAVPPASATATQATQPRMEVRKVETAKAVQASPAATQQLQVSPASAQLMREVKVPPMFVLPQLPAKTGFTWRHDFGDTKYHHVAYQTIATTRFREYFLPTPPDRPVKLTRESSVFEVDIPNAARPEAPKVLYVIPTFEWERETEVKFDRAPQLEVSGVALPQLKGLKGVATVSKRRGGGLRVYMDRPWYSSGDKELLGVVLWPSTRPAAPAPGATGLQPAGRAALTPVRKEVQTAKLAAVAMQMAIDVPKELKLLVTQWGLDPIWESRPVPDLPSLSHCKGATETGVWLTLDELGQSGQAYRDEHRVSVAGYQPEYDKERQLWYCDIRLDPGLSYFPFLRLALARFHPISVENAHLSRVVMADFAQLAPDRTASLVYDPKDAKKLDVVVAGLSYSRSAAGAGPGEVEISLESNPLGKENDLGWTPVPKGVIPLRPQPLGGVTVWRGEIDLGKLKPPKTQALRVVIREYERYLADYRPGAQPVVMTNIPTTMPVRRLVYADVMHLPAVMGFIS